MMMEPPIEELVEKIGHGKYALVTVASKRARQINEYYLQLGSSHGGYIPPQVTTTGKPLSIAFDEIDQDKLLAVEPPEIVVVESAEDADGEAVVAVVAEADATDGDAD